MRQTKFIQITKAPMLLGECPLWHPLEMKLYWIDIAGFAVYRFDPASGDQKVWHMPSEPGCIAWRQAGGLVVAMRSGIAFLDTESGILSDVMAAPYDTKAFRFNDGRCDSAGRFWMGTLVDARNGPYGKLYCLERGTLRAFDHPVVVSNGVAFSPDFSRMYHADTAAHRINVYNFDALNGNTEAGRLFRIFPTTGDSGYLGRPDGAAVDSEGAYWVAMYEGARVLKLSPEGLTLLEIPVPMMCPTMVAFGGHDLRTLYITGASQKRSQKELESLPLSGAVLAMKVEVAGQTEYGYLD